MCANIGHNAGFHVIAGNAGISQHPFNGEMIANRGERGGFRELGARTTDEHHMTRSGIDELTGNQPAALFMIGSNGRNTLAQRAIKSNNRTMNGCPVAARMLGVGRHDDAVHHVPLQHVDIFTLAFVCISDGTQ